MDLYRSLEEKYYSAMDWLEERGVKAYEWFVNPIEARGIPSFPVAVIVLIALIAGIALVANALLAVPSTVTMKVSVYSKDKMEPVAGASVKLLVEGVETPFLAKTNAQGVAEFAGLPPGKHATIRVDESALGFAPFFKETETRETVVSAELENAAPSPEKNIVVYVSNNDGQYLSDALIVYPDPLTGQVVQKNTDATGSAKLDFSTDSDIFKLKVSREGFASKYVTCFASQSECTVTLAASSELPADNTNSSGGGSQETKGSIAVIVKNDEGQSVAAKVTVYDADHARAIAVGESTASSPAFFQDAAALGVSVFVLVEPKDATYFYYNGGQENDLQPVSRDTEFRVTLKRRVQLNTGIISITAVDEQGNPIEGATATLLLTENPTRVLLTNATDSDGRAGFEVSLGSSVYFTVYADGFLPFLQKSADVGGSYKIALTKLVPGNNAQAKALVVDDEDKPVELASVQVLTSDGFYAGFPALESSEDGSVLFEGLALDEYRFLASLGSRKGLSDSFVPTITEALEVKVRLSPLLAAVTARAVDVTTNKTIAANVSVLVDGNAVASCNSTPVKQCSFNVKANKAFELKAEAKDYAPSTSEEIILTPDQSLNKTLSLIPSSLARDLQIIDFHLERVDEPSTGSGDASFVERGMVYRGVLTVNFPANADSNGFFLRVGDKPTAGEDIAAITFFDQPADATISLSSLYNPGPDCASDLQNQAGDEAKWVDYEFPPARDFGVHAIAVKIFVKPTATKNDVLKVFYRAYSVKGNTWTRKPFDDALNYSEKTKGLDSCYAKTLQKNYAVVEGNSVCTPDACLITWFEAKNEKKNNGLVLNLGDKFETHVEVRAFKPLASPYVKVSADPAVVFNNFVFDNASGTAAGESSFKTDVSLSGESGFATSTGVINSTAKLPSSYARVFIEFGESGSEGENALAAVKKYVVVQGVGELVLTVNPETIYANEKTDLMVWVTRRDDGKPVTDARVFIRETSGYPFDGSPNGVYEIQGDGSEGAGADGKYVFKRLHPTSVGAFEVVAQREGFKDAALEVTVSARNFLEFNPDIAQLSLKCDAMTLEVSTQLDAVTPVTASFAGTPCVALSGPSVFATGNYSWSFNVKPGKPTLVQLEPIRGIPCYLVFNSVLSASGAADAQTAWIKVDCKKLEPTPTPSPGAGACNSANCTSCNERDCIALANYCTPRYVKLPDNSSVFSQCLQKGTGANATPTPTLAPGDCGAGQCWNCNETSCLTLMQNQSCMPQYYYLPQGQRIFLNCTNFTMPDCSPANFNFESILARRLAQYHSQLLLNPTTQSRAIGVTAGVKIVFDQFGLKVSDAGNCVSGADMRSITCERKINPIVPTNAMAFTIFNQFSFETTFSAKIVGGANKCFRLVNVDEKTPLQKLANLPADISASLGIGVSTRYRTWLIQFLPREGCVEYTYDDGGLSIEPTSAGSTITLLISPVRAEQYSVQLTLNIASHNTDLTKKYAFLFAPFKAVEEKSGVFVNNMQAGQKIKLTGGVAEESRDGTLEIGSQRIGISTVSYGADKKLHVNAFVGAEAKSELGEIVLDPLANADDPALQCSNDKCCAKTEFDAAKQAAVDEVKQLFSEILPDVETIYNGNIMDGSASVFNKALDDAIGDYLSKAATYELCKRVGIDPLQKLNATCQAKLAQPLALGEDDQSKGFGEMYGDAFMSSGCDSELMNYGMGFSQAVGGNQFWDAFKNRLQGMLTPKTGSFYQKTFVVPIDFSVNVVLKQGNEATQKASIELIKISPKDVNTPDLMQAGSNWINLEGVKPIPLYGLYGTGVGGVGLANVQNPVTMLTGCLAPYFGGNPNSVKVDRCKLWPPTVSGKTLYSGKLQDYCKDPVEQQEPQGKPLPVVPVPPVEGQPKTTEPCFTTYNGFTLCQSSADCLLQTQCAGVTAPYVPNALGYGCYDTYFALVAGTSLTFSKDQASLPGSKRYWLCTQTNYLNKGNGCVPLRDVYDEMRLLPTMCSADDKYARCHWDENANDAYKCCLKAGNDCVGSTGAGGAGATGGTTAAQQASRETDAKSDAAKKVAELSDNTDPCNDKKIGDSCDKSDTKKECVMPVSGTKLACLKLDIVQPDQPCIAISKPDTVSQCVDYDKGYKCINGVCKNYAPTPQEFWAWLKGEIDKNAASAIAYFQQKISVNEKGKQPLQELLQDSAAHAPGEAARVPLQMLATSLKDCTEKLVSCTPQAGDYSCVTPVSKNFLVCMPLHFVADGGKCIEFEEEKLRSVCFWNSECKNGVCTPTSAPPTQPAPQNAPQTPSGPQVAEQQACDDALWNKVTANTLTGICKAKANSGCGCTLTNPGDNNKKEFSCGVKIIVFIGGAITCSKSDCKCLGTKDGKTQVFDMRDPQYASYLTT